ncbi:MAG: NAD-dependent epimerase/dehydratase family protein [Bryobacterales bacterium]
MKSLVTGGLGFLGSHLVDVLLEKGDEVTIVDNLSTNAVPQEGYTGRCRVLDLSVEDYECDETFDVVYHLASVVGPAGVLTHAGRIGYSIMVETDKLISMCSKQNAKFVLISTSEVYGRDGVFAENVDKIVPGIVSVRTEYGAGKLLAEIATINRARVIPLKYHIIRPFNISGSRQKPDGGFVLPRFVVQAVKGEDITVFGKGTQLRAFTHARDISEATVGLAHSDLASDIWNIGNIRNLMTINELAEAVKKACGSSSKIVHLDGKEIYGPLYEEAFDKLPNITKIETHLGWKPRFTLDEIIQDVVAYYTKRAPMTAGS